MKISLCKYVYLKQMLSDLMNKIKPSPTIAMSNKAKAMKADGINVIDFSFGEPDLDTPQHIINAAKYALDNGMTKYTIVDGTIELKKAIVGKLKRENNLDYETSEISVGTGAKQVIFNAIAATVCNDDEVIIPTPSWVSYVDIVAMFNGKPVLVETNINENFKLSGEKLEKAITPKTKWIILNSPSNPTGMIYAKEDLIQITDVMRKYPHVHLMSDDIYEHIIFDGMEYVNILNIAPDLVDRVMIINGVSKAYCMTGFRIGYGVIKNQKIINAIRTIQSQSTSNPNSIAQYAAKIALDDKQSLDFIRKMRLEMQERRDYICKELDKIAKIQTPKPNGAFYVFVCIEDLIGKQTKDGKIINSGDDFCNYLLEDKHIATVSGEAFGTKNHFRISYSTNIENIKIGLKGIREFIENVII